MQSETDTVNVVHERFEKIPYSTIVWQQLKKNRLAVVGLWSLVVLINLAIFAPLIALNKPFFFIIGDAVEFPWLISLFDRNFFENSIDIFFNLLMLMAPVHLVVYLTCRMVMTPIRFRRIRARFFLIMTGVQILVFIGISLFPLKRPYRDYKSMVTELSEKEEDVKYLFPPIRYSYRETNVFNVTQAPGRDHYLGTDIQGRDVLTRMLYGARISLTIGVVAVSIYVFIGIILGSLAGYFGGKTDIVISRLIEVMICFPSFFLIITLAAFIEERSIFHIMLIIGITRWTGVARLIRGEFLKLKNMDYVQAARALGLSRIRIIFGHVLPNAIAPVLVTATFGIAAAILIESGLAFLGIGDPSAPSWGEILSMGRAQMKSWLILTPGFAIFFVVSMFNLVGEGIRDALDPKLRQ